MAGQGLPTTPSVTTITKQYITIGQNDDTPSSYIEISVTLASFWEGDYSSNVGQDYAIRNERRAELDPEESKRSENLPPALQTLPEESSGLEDPEISSVEPGKSKRYDRELVRAGTPGGPLKHDERTEVGRREDIVRGDGRAKRTTAGKRKTWCATSARH